MGSEFLECNEPVIINEAPEWAPTLSLYENWLKGSSISAIEEMSDTAGPPPAPPSSGGVNSTDSPVNSVSKYLSNHHY